jgi:predicted MFS family arabinose efflux permease
MFSGRYRHYLLGLLLVILAFNYVDRLALGLLLQDIKSDLRLSDTELGVLSGLAFAAFYAVMGIPIARWADRGDRVLIIALTAALWSVAVALCGTANGFFQLLVIRIGVAIGEAGCIPPAHSLIADNFERAARPRAVAIYMLGTPLAMVIGNFGAGWLNELYGWRTTFMLLGLPGLALAGLAICTLREPRRGQARAEKAADPVVRPSTVSVFRALWGSHAFRHLLACFSVVSFFGYGLLQWQPAFFMRSFGLESGELGSWFALVWGGGGLLGTIAGGEWASRWAADREDVQLRVVAIMYALFGLVSVALYLSTDRHLALLLMALATFGSYTISGPLFATIQTLVRADMRAMSIAILYLFGNLIGMGLGPLAAGMISDVLRPSLGEESLRYALLILSPGYVWGAWHAWQASRTARAEIAALDGALAGGKPA